MGQRMCSRVPSCRTPTLDVELYAETSTATSSGSREDWATATVGPTMIPMTSKYSGRMIDPRDDTGRARAPGRSAGRPTGVRLVQRMLFLATIAENGNPLRQPLAQQPTGRLRSLFAWFAGRNGAVVRGG